MPALEAPPAPSKPVAAPVKTVPEPKAPPPIPDGEKPPKDYFGDITNELDDLDKDQSSDSPQPRDAKGRLLPKPKPAEPNPDAAPKPGDEPAKPDAVLKPEDELKPGTFRALGAAHDKLQKLVKDELRPKLQSAEAKVTQLESQLAEARKGAPDLKPIQERQTALETENAALKEEIRYVNYQKHPEFVEKYQKPYTEAWAKAVSEITQFNIETEAGAARKATADDFLTLANAPLDQVDDLADKWFGRAAPRVIRHVEKIRDMAESQDKALADARKNAGEHEKQTVAQRQAADLAVSTAYTGAQKELIRKYSKWFAPDPEDAPGNELLAKSKAYVDTVFHNAPVKQPDGAMKSLTQEQRAKRLAVIEQKATAFDRLVARSKAKDARISELETTLAEYEKSEPGAERASQPGRVGNKPFMEVVEDEIHQLEAHGR
jgi:hypothetical protein